MSKKIFEMPLSQRYTGIDSLSPRAQVFLVGALESKCIMEVKGKMIGAEVLCGIQLGGNDTLWQAYGRCEREVVGRAYASYLASMYRPEDVKMFEDFNKDTRPLDDMEWGNYPA
ncbi:hypothetical protein J4212_05180 [Candidatus Woesearchaeota archaeon]|nr:hypothetical protein [Candidatus Woesearchaeota archaeon]